MNKSDLIAAVAAKTGDTKKNAETSINALIDVIAESLKDGEKIQVVGFGSFEVRERAERKGRNPQTGAELKIAPSEVYKSKINVKIEKKK